MPAASSRSPQKRVSASCSPAPIERPRARGASSSAAPSAMLNQPRPRASWSIGSGRRCVCAALARGCARCGR